MWLWTGDVYPISNVLLAWHPEGKFCRVDPPVVEYGVDGAVGWKLRPTRERISIRQLGFFDPRMPKWLSDAVQSRDDVGVPPTSGFKEIHTLGSCSCMGFPISLPR